MFQLILSVAIVFLTVSCGKNQTPDDEQKQINLEAFQNRFDKETTESKENGIKISPEILPSLPQAKLKMVLMTGDDSISAFDNARKKLFTLFSAAGIKESIQLSRSASQQVNGVRATSIPNFEKALKDLKIKDGEGCLVHMTSHGSKTGFYIRGQNYLTPTQLNQIIKDQCGTRPTVLLVSACYSGVFAEPSMEAPNRIILTAARKDRTSFGCSAEATYTYWDACLVTNLPLAKTWFELAGKMEKCIEAKESAGSFARSYPQARFGSQVKDLEIAQ